NYCACPSRTAKSPRYSAHLPHGSFKKERGQPCPRECFGEMIEPRGHGCPRSVREILESAVSFTQALCSSAGLKSRYPRPSAGTNNPMSSLRLSSVALYFGRFPAGALAGLLTSLQGFISILGTAQELHPPAEASNSARTAPSPSASAEAN